MRISRVVFETDSLRIRAVRCRAPAHDWGDIEFSSVHTVVLPQSGVFVKYEQPHGALVADPAHAVFLTADRPYRVSHPTSLGDDCLVLEVRPPVLWDVLNKVDPAATDTPRTPFRVGMVPLRPRAILRRRLLWHRLARGTAGRLEVEEVALELFGAAIDAGRPDHSTSRQPRGVVSRRSEIVRLTQTAIAARPSEPLTLEALARRVQCSPFHLAHVFREDVGLPIHQCQLLARLTQALDGVLDSSDRLSAIALEAGFTHHSHFTARFRRAFGLTPSQLRRQATTGQVIDLRKILTARPCATGSPRNVLGRRRASISTPARDDT